MTAGTKGHRWPAQRKAQPAHPGNPDPIAELYQAVGDLAPLLRALAPSVLDTSTFLLDANGQATKQFRVPFAAVAVTSASVNQLTIVASTPGASAPGPGQGAGQVPQLGFVAHNISGYNWTVYGGNPGDQITVSTFGRPIPPVGESGIVIAQSFGQASFVGQGTSTSPGALQQITTTGALAAGLYRVSWQLSLAGTVAAADANNFQLKQGGTTVVVNGLIAAVAGEPVPQVDCLVRVPAPGGTAIRILALGAGTAGAIYGAQIAATQVGP